ncbi:MAG: DUF3857 domain-containing protein [Bacteroidales bacterium]|nr:DUF3857 domain-containing protein [Bacteroidales bacterium]
MKKFIWIIIYLLISYFGQSQTNIAEVISYHTKVELQEKKLSKSHQISIRINSKQGLKYATVQIPIYGSEKKPHIKAYITDENGEVIRKLKKKDLVLKSDINDFSLYTDDFVYEFSMYHNKYPYTLHYSYETGKRNYLFLAHWSPLDIHNIPIQNAKLDILIPADLEVNIKESNIQTAKITNIEDQLLYSWEAQETKTEKAETFQAQNNNQIPYVIVSPISFFYDIPGSNKSWESYGLWKNGLLEGLDNLPEREKSKINKLILDTSSDHEKIEKLYQLLQEETRYINVSIDVGGLKPYPASYVAENKYGDCKALSNYFKAVLEYAGINSYYTNIYAGDKILEIDTTFPSQQFNHAILFVPLEEDTMWIDCTSDMKCGYVGSFIQNRNAFVINGDQSFLIKTPALKKEDVQLSRNFYIWQNLSGNANIKVRNSYKGSIYEQLYYLLNSIEEHRKMNLLKRFIVEGWLESPEKIIFLTNEENSEIILDYKSTSKKVFQSLNHEVLFNIPRFNFPDLEKPKYRKSSVQIDYPIYFTDKVVFELTKGEKIIDYPKSIENKTEFGSYRIQTELTDKQFIISKYFYLKAGKYSLDQYEAFYSFISKAKRKDKNLIITFKNK